MKSDKQPASQSQALLEEYVDFLLTPDLPNASSNRKQKKKHDLLKNTVQKATEQIATNQDDVIAASNTAGAGAKPEPKTKSKPLIAPVATNNTKEKPVSMHSTFVEESEEEELRKWDALLAREKNKEKIEGKKEESAAPTKDNPAGNISQPSIITREKTPGSLVKKIQTVKKQTVSVSGGTDKLTSNVLNAQQMNDHSIQGMENSLHSEKASNPSLSARPFAVNEMDSRLANVEKLLAKISLASSQAKPGAVSGHEVILTQGKLKPVVKSEAKVDSEDETGNETKTKIDTQAAEATFLPRDSKKLRDVLPDIFQTLIFKVAQLPLAVPLLKLGGIVRLVGADITPLVGSPDWFMGLIPNERGNLMVIDTQKYLMPERSNQKGESNSENGPDYEYLIVLDNSNWALACHSVGDAKNLTQNDIRWSERTSKRPWFAGMVVDYMSALIEVDELINMLADNIVE